MISIKLFIERKYSDGKIIINKLDQLIIMQKFRIACDFR